MTSCFYHAVLRRAWHCCRKSSICLFCFSVWPSVTLVDCEVGILLKQFHHELACGVHFLQTIDRDNSFSNVMHKSMVHCL